jgi:L-threonylcarbamoyladenylate synthase
MLMKRVVLPFRGVVDWKAAAAGAAGHLRSGGLLAHPTETVYGIGCALRLDALARLARIKDRAGRPFIVLAGGPEPLDGLDWPADAARLADAFWPGPLTLIVRAEPAAFPDALLGPGGTVAVRATSHPGLRIVIREFGEPMTSTSANPPGLSPATGFREAVSALERLDPGGSVWLLDGGDLEPSLPSTVVDCTTRPPRIVRAGATAERIREVIRGIEPA